MADQGCTAVAAFQGDDKRNRPLTYDTTRSAIFDIPLALADYYLVRPVRPPRTYVDGAYQQSLDHSVPRFPHYTLSPERVGGITYDRTGSDRRIEDGEPVLNNRVNGPHLPFPSSTTPPPTTFPSQSASSYSNSLFSRVEERRSDARETQPLPNAAFEILFACAVAGAATTCGATLSASRGDITALTLSAAFFISTAAAAGMMALQIAAEHIIPSVPSHSRIVRGYMAITSIGNIIGVGILLYAIGTLGSTENGGFTGVRGDAKGQQAAAIFTAVMTTILILGGIALPFLTTMKSSIPASDCEKASKRDDLHAATMGLNHTQQGDATAHQ